MTVALGALALFATACSSLTRPEEITISAEPVGPKVAAPPPAPAAPQMPMAAPAQGG
jgi:hypothetical protein